MPFSNSPKRGRRDFSRGPKSHRPIKAGDQIERPRGSVYQYGTFRYVDNSNQPSSEGAGRPGAPKTNRVQSAAEFLSTLSPEILGKGARGNRRPAGGPRGDYRQDRPDRQGPSASSGGFDHRAAHPYPNAFEFDSRPGPHSRGGYSDRSSGPRGSYGPSRPHSRGFGSRGPAGPRKRRGREESIDYRMFINKAPTNISASTASLPEIKNTFMDFALDDRLKRAVVAKGYITPSPIQDQSIPLILEGRDIVGIANTGTGKTAAFLLPLIDKVLKNNKEQILVVAPTRELAIQIDQEFKDLSRGSGLFSACCVGGVSVVGQIRELRYFNNFIIGTPGRLKDMIERGYIRLENFNTIVLDEADQMLDMGFISDMKYLVAKMPPVRHTLFFSATLSPEIERLIGDFLTNPARVMVKTRDTSKDVDQDVVFIEPGMNKFSVLTDLLKQPGMDKVIVFCKTKHGAEKLSHELIKNAIKAESIHGDKEHRHRQRALKLFKDHHVQVLVATDVAARGLDISGVSHVINFDLPSTYTDYVHRIGRTGRAGKQGQALTFIERGSGLHR